MSIPKIRKIIVYYLSFFIGLKSLDISINSMDQILTRLLKLADHLDEQSLFEEADALTEILEKINLEKLRKQKDEDQILSKGTEPVLYDVVQRLQFCSRR